MPRRLRNAQGSGSIRQRKDGSWEGRYTVGRDPGTGKQVQKSVYGRTQAEVRKKVTAALRDIDQGIYTDPEKITFGAWLDNWHSDYLGAVKQSTAAQYEYQIRVHIKPALGKVKLQALTAPMIQRMYNQSIQEGLSPKSVRNIHGVIHKALDQAVKLQYIRTNPSLACQLPRVEKKEMHPLEGTYIKAFLDAIKGHPYEELMFVTVFTGMRQGEVLGLTWDCINFDKGTITVSKQLQKERIVGGGGNYRFVPLKNDKQRTLTASQAVIDMLRCVQRKQEENQRLFGPEWDNALNLVFTTPSGKHLSKPTVYENFKRVAEKIGLPETRFHDLRHTFATLSLQNGDDIKTVSENLGHATTSFTLDVYGHVTEQMKKDSAQRMQNLIDNL